MDLSYLGGCQEKNDETKRSDLLLENLGKLVA
jgi:hypothetical protein